MPETAHQMVVHHPRGLHEGIADCAAHELEAAEFELFAHGVGLRASGWDPGLFGPGVHAWLAPGELPDKAVEGTKLSLDGQKCPGVGDGRRDLQPVADDSGISQQAGYLISVERGDLPGLKILERPPEILPLVEHARPAQSSLERVQHQKLEQLAVVMQRHTPLFIVILQHQRVGAWPAAASSFGHAWVLAFLGGLGLGGGSASAVILASSASHWASSQRSSGTLSQGLAPG